jgi:hypothetical protein
MALASPMEKLTALQALTIRYGGPTAANEKGGLQGRHTQDNGKNRKMKKGKVQSVCKLYILQCKQKQRKKEGNRDSEGRA